jgi:hypothetical protein
MANYNDTKVIRHVFGNVLRVSIPLTQRTVDINDGVETYTDADFVPNAGYPVKVMLTSGAKSIGYTASMSGNVATFEDLGKLPIGSYAVTVTCKDDEMNPMRFKARLVIKVVDCTEDAQDGGIGWYDGMDGKSIYPIVKKNSENGM